MILVCQEVLVFPLRQQDQDFLLNQLDLRDQVDLDLLVHLVDQVVLKVQYLP